MVALGLILLLIAGLVTAGMVLQNTDASSASVFGQAVHGTVGGLFLAGVVTGVVALLGVALMVSGASRRRSRRLGMKRAVRDARGEKESLAEENARLQRELAATRGGEYPVDSRGGEYPVDSRGGEYSADTVATPVQETRHGIFRR